MRQLTAFAAIIAVSGCGSSGLGDSPLGNDPGSGLAVSDEPKSVLTARDILLAGGSAADAAVAMYFTMSVTYPSSAGLGGGGVCVARTPPARGEKNPRVEVLEFLGAASSAPSQGTPIAVPANVRGMYALHARYGRLRWGQVIRPAERLARFGTPVSRAFARELAQGAARLADGAARRAFQGRGGTLAREGDHIEQMDLAGALGRLRIRGPADFYTGALARKLVNGAREAGLALSAADLRNFKPRWLKPIEYDAGKFSVFLPPAGGGKVAADMWKTLYDDGGYRRAPTTGRDKVLIDATAASLRKAGAPPSTDAMPDPAVASFVAMDGSGGAVSCAVTLNGHFGSGRLIRGAGFTAAAAPGSALDGRWALAPMIVASNHTPTAFAAAAPSGNAAAPVALVATALRILVDEQDAGKALAAARVYPASAGAAHVERRGGARLTPVSAPGVRQIAAQTLGRVNLIYCAEGLPSEKNACVFHADPRGFGHAVDAVSLGR